MSPRKKTEDETPLDDSANFPIKRRQAMLRGKKDTKKKMEKVRDQIEHNLQAERDRMKWVDDASTD